MSLGIYRVFKPDLQDAKCVTLGESLAQEFEALDELAEAHGLTPFTAFADTREIPDGFDGTPEELEELMGPWEDWFPCDKGIAAFEALAGLIMNDPTAAQTLDEPHGVLSELQDIIQSLRAAKKQGGTDWR